MQQNREHLRFLLFVALGGFAAALNIAVRILFSLVMSYESAVALAAVVGLVTAFLLNRRFVFDASTRRTSVQLSRFAAANVVAFAQVWLVSVVLARYVLPSVGLASHADLLGHAIGVASPIVTSYYLHRDFSFR
jgi:putative flippase GtrA